MNKKNKVSIPFAIAGFLAALISVLMLLHRHWDSGASFNETVLAAWGTIMSAIFTTATVWFLYKQIGEQIKVRKLSVQPFILPTNIQLHLSDYQNHELGVAAGQGQSIFQAQFQQIEHGAILQHFGGLIPLSNMGNGLAKEISVEWQYDSGIIIEKIIGIYYAEGYLNNVEKFNFIQKEKSIVIPIPVFYMQVCGLRLNNPIAAMLNPAYIIDKPPLRLMIKYKDISDEEFENRYEVSFNYWADNIDMRFEPIR